MGPSCRKRRRRKKASSRSRRRPLFLQDEEILSSHEGTNSPVVDDSNGDSFSECSTPKAERFRIPEIKTCPPAPKKRQPKIVNFSLRRTPKAFFATPDIDIFFHFALRGIPAV